MAVSAAIGCVSFMTPVEANANANRIWMLHSAIWFSLLIFAAQNFVTTCDLT